MAALPERVKIYIVQSLSCFLTPTQVMKAVKEDFNLDVTRQQVQGYDPTKFVGRALSKQLTELFYESREKFKVAVMDIPVAQQAYRLMTLQNLVNKNLDRGNDPFVAELLKQAAQEVGGQFTNKQLVGQDQENPWLVLYNQIKGNSIPTVTDDEIFEGEVVDFNEPVARNELASQARDLKTPKVQKVLRSMDRD